MVNINQYINTGSNTPVISQSPIDQNAILNIGGQVTQALAQNLGSDLQAADQAKRQALRANLIAKETEHQAGLSLQESYIKTNQILLTGINQIAAIDESKRKEEEKKLSTLYNLNAFSKMNTDYLQFLDSANSSMNPDGSGYTQNVQAFLDKQIESYVNSAPSEDAKFDFYTQASEFKLKAMASALNVEQKTRAVFRQGLITDSADQIINQTLLNPTNADSYLGSVDALRSVLHINGFNESQADAFVKQKT